MAIKIFEKFAPRANPADGDYPYGSIKNESVPGAKDGTPLDAVWGNDYAGFDAALLGEAGIVPSGLADTVNASQRLEAISKICGRQFASVDELASGKFQVGTYVKIIDRDNGIFKILNTGTINGTSIVNAGDGNVAVYQPLLHDVVKVTHLGANGLVDDTEAFQAAGDVSSSVFCPKLATPYKVSTVETTQTVSYYGSMDGKTEIETIGGVNNPMFFNRVTGRKLAVKDLTLKGSGLNGVGALTPHFRGVGIWCSAGELDVTGCTLEMFSAQAIWTGNISDNWDINVYVDRCNIEHNVIKQGELADALGDCMRLERTNNMTIQHNECSGGLSGIRSQLFCKDFDISHNHVYGSYADVGITCAHSTDGIVTHNDCHNHFSHGLEIDSSFRVQVAYNKAHGNGKRGILVSEYATPNDSWYAGFLDGVLISPGQYVWPDLNDVSNNKCFNNGESGLHFISPRRCTGSSNKFWNNCVSNPAFDTHVVVGTTINSSYSQDLVLNNSEYNNSLLCSAGLRIDAYQTESLSPIKVFDDKIINGGLLSRQPTYGSSNRIDFDSPVERLTASYLVANQDQSLDGTHGYAWQLVDDVGGGQRSLTFNVKSASYVRRLLAKFKFKGVSSVCKMIVQEYFVDVAGVETFRRTLSTQTFTSSATVSSRIAYIDSTNNNDYNIIKVQFVTDDDAGATVNVLDAHLSWVE